MNNYYKQACCFMNLLSRFINDEKNYILPVNDYEKIIPDKVLIGYYDNEYIYFIPNVVIGMCDTILMQNKCKVFNMKEVLRLLYLNGYIKSDLEQGGKIHYRSKKCIGKTRKRYITFMLDNTERKSERKAVSKDTYTISETIKKYVCADAEYAAKCEEDVVEGIFNSLLSGEKVKIGNIGTLDIIKNSDGTRVPVFKVDGLFIFALNSLYCGKG